MAYGLDVKPEGGHYPSVKKLEGGNGPIPALDQTPDGGVNGAGHLGGKPVDGSNFPTKMRWNERKDNPPPDFDSIPHLNVSERAKQAIESLEPGVHQFFPVEYFTKQGRFLETRYWFVVCNRIDAMDRDRTNMFLWNGWVWRTAKDMIDRGITLPPQLDPNEKPRLVFNRDQIGGVHIWRDKHLEGGPFVSEVARRRFEAEHLTGLRWSNNGVETV